MFTPIELYNDIYVKREDLCFSSPAPPFSKLRGLLSHLKKQKEKGITTIGYMDTSISMGGWGVAWACQKLNLKSVIFNPVYKNPCETLLFHREQWKKLGADIIDLQAGRTKVNWYIARKILNERYVNSLLLPLSLILNETILETAIEAKKTIKKVNVKSIIICIGSGTIASGLWLGLDQIKWKGSIYGIMSTSGNIKNKLKSIEKKSGLNNNGIFKSGIKFNLYDPGWQYTEKATILAPFPCNIFYDCKAWQWLVQNKDKLPKPILFWNIGH